MRGVHSMMRILFWGIPYSLSHHSLKIQLVVTFPVYLSCMLIKVWNVKKVNVVARFVCRCSWMLRILVPALIWVMIVVMNYILRATSVKFNWLFDSTILVIIIKLGLVNNAGCASQSLVYVLSRILHILALSVIRGRWNNLVFRIAWTIKLILGLNNFS